MRQTYNKLVRDQIPDIIRADGRDCGLEIMTQEEYQGALLEKLVEEAQEAQQAGREGLVTELADLYEVIDALIEAYGLDRDTVLRTQQTRHEERGGFTKRIRLLWTE